MRIFRFFLLMFFLTVNLRDLLWEYQKASGQYHFEKCETKGAVFLK